jgi:hypothetical protein
MAAVVNLCATFWNREQRAAHEGWMLRRYHAGLATHGVAGYLREALVADVFSQG